MHNDLKLERAFVFYVGTLLFFSVGAITTLGLDWYNTLVLPSWIPPQLLIATLWFVLFLTTGKSVSLFWETGERGTEFFRTTISLYLANILLVLLWNYAFFGLHNLALAQSAGTMIGVSVMLLMARLWNEKYRSPALLLVPYLGWVPIALWITYEIMKLNPGMQ